ncbi:MULTISPECIES: hypothetical protein [unclassified Microbulbifer]|uniref:hypothetical protein n=1 Tax=unclassified Microbulbifer TaxID=2619833 RepID=UPI0027E3D91B|nr:MULTISPECIES: hypothetical protein [unclassified Microbulbifer]
MRKVLLSTQAIFMVVFFIAFVVSFFVVDKIEEESRLLVTEKLVKGTSSKVDLAEEVLNSRAANMYLKDYQIDVIREEIDTFKTNPYKYVESLTIDAENVVIIPPEFETNNPLEAALFEKIFSWKQGLKSYFNKTFSGLITDIRIFLGTNFIALLIAAFVCFKATSLGNRAMALSAIITIATALSAFSYINANWLLNVLLNSYAGYGYAGGIAILTGWLYLEYSDKLDKNAYQTHATDKF